MHPSSDFRRCRLHRGNPILSQTFQFPWLIPRSNSHLLAGYLVAGHTRDRRTRALHRLDSVHAVGTLQSDYPETWRSSHCDVAALYVSLDNLIAMFKQRGWNPIDAEHAY